MLELTTNTFAAAHKWLAAARTAEQCKLAAQVMLGRELQTLRKKFDVKHGGDRKSKSHDGNLIAKADWETLLKTELNLSRSTAYRYEELWKAAQPRLKKLPAEICLEDILALPLSELDEAHTHYLTTAVDKLTDGKTQGDFLSELGLYKTGGTAPTRESQQKGGLASQAARAHKTAEQAHAELATAIIADWSEKWHTHVRLGSVDDLPLHELRNLHEFLKQAHDLITDKLKSTK